MRNAGGTPAFPGVQASECRGSPLWLPIPKFVEPVETNPDVTAAFVSGCRGNPLWLP